MTNSERRFAVLILSHGRPDRVITYDSLRRYGYEGPVYLVVDDEDPTLDAYRERFGDAVVVFDKRAEAAQTDVGDIRPERNVVVFARNAAFGIARELGLTHFLVLDDDYRSFVFRSKRGGKVPREIGAVMDATLDLLDVSGAVTVAWSQGGDHFGGVAGGYAAKGLTRKAMNAFFLRVDRPFRFMGRVNEDVNAYVVHGSRGLLFLTTTRFQLNQLQTQSNPGGLTDEYLASGTYVKSFYTVMMAPSCAKIGAMGRTDRRFHHEIAWDNAVPKIVSGRYRKTA